MQINANDWTNETGVKSERERDRERQKERQLKAKALKLIKQI